MGSKDIWKRKLVGMKVRLVRSFSTVAVCGADGGRGEAPQGALPARCCVLEPDRPRSPWTRGTTALAPTVSRFRRKTLSCVKIYDSSSRIIVTNIGT